MTEVSANRFRQHLKHEVDRAIAEHRPIRVRRRRGGDFVVLGAEDWRAIEATLALNQVPGLVDSIHRAAAEPLADGTPLAELDW
jgi:prevent-host-death family protein